MPHRYAFLRFTAIVLILAAFASASCKSSGNKPETVETTIVDQPTETVQEPVRADNIMNRGEDVYNEVCLACHQADGSGVPMMFPPVTASDIINGDHGKLIKLIMDGLSGPVEIKGEKYNSVMPPQKHNLNDQQISDLLTFLRNSFGNRADTITAAEVAKLRK